MASAQVTITQLPAAGPITGDELVPIVQNGQTVQTTTGDIAIQPTQTQSFLTAVGETSLPNSRTLAVGSGLSLADGGAQGTMQINVTGAASSLNAAGNGLMAKTGISTLVPREIEVGTGLGITNGTGVAGNPLVALGSFLSSYQSLSGSTGLVSVSGGAATSRAIVGTSDQISVSNGDGSAGNPAVAIATNPILPGVGGTKLPTGTTAERLAGVTNGTIRYNTDTQLFEGYLNGSWTAFASGSGVTSITAGAGLTGGTITSTGTIAMEDTAVTPGSYTTANITVNSRGQITAAANGAGGVTSVSGGTTGLTPATATTGDVVLAGTLVVGNGGTGATSLTGYVKGNGTSAMTAASTVPTSDLSGTISNGQLANSAITLGTTSTSLGGTSLTLGGLTSVAVTQDPTTALQLATKQYVDGLASTGLYYHAPVQAATTASLASITGGTVTYDNGTAGVGATLTLSVPLTTLDGYSLANTNRILVQNESTQANNGVYTWATGGTVLTRSTDTDTYGTGSGDLSENDYFFCQNGTVNAGNSFVCTTAGTITFGTTAITFAQFSTSQVYTGTSPVQVSGTVISLNTVPTTLGGTGLTSFTSGGAVYATSTSALTTGTLPIASGGTGLASFTAGDLPYYSTGTALSKLSIGTTDYILTSSGTAPQYTNPSSITVGSATTATNIAGGIASQIPYQTGVGSTSFIANGTAGQVLTSAGTGAPVWSGISGGTF